MRYGRMYDAFSVLNKGLFQNDHLECGDEGRFKTKSITANLRGCHGLNMNSISGRFRFSEV